MASFSLLSLDTFLRLCHIMSYLEKAGSSAEVRRTDNPSPSVRPPGMGEFKVQIGARTEMKTSELLRY